MVRNDWWEVAKLFDGVGMEVSLATNGTMVTQGVATLLASLKKVSISVSVDGDRETHDRLRNQKGAHGRTMQGLYALLGTRLPFDVNATICRDNLPEVAFLTRLARDLDCDVRLSLLHPNGRGQGMAEKALEPEEIFRLREYCHVMRQRGVRVFLNLPPLLQYLDEVIPSRGSACGWAVSFCGVLANGDVSICGVASDEPDLVAGNIREQRFRGIWASSPLFRQTRSLKVNDLQGICGRCPFNEYCGGACRLSAFRATADFLAPYGLCQRFYDQGYVPEALLDPVIGHESSATGTLEAGETCRVGEVKRNPPNSCATPTLLPRGHQDEPWFMAQRAPPSPSPSPKGRGESL